LYEPVHHHTSGVISYTLPTPTASMDPHSEAYRLLQELREKAQEGAPCEILAD
jgi:hypothetical protein